MKKWYTCKLNSVQVETIEQDVRLSLTDEGGQFADMQFVVEGGPMTKQLFVMLATTAWKGGKVVQAWVTVPSSTTTTGTLHHLVVS